MYENCTVVTSNLEISHLYPDPGSDFDLSFFENIREVHGYVFVVSNLVSRVPLTSLRVIRGLVKYYPETEHDDVGFSLYVVANSYRPEDGVERGLRILELPALRGTCIRGYFEGNAVPVLKMLMERTRTVFALLN